jgi:hypothetical protein
MDPGLAEPNMSTFVEPLTVAFSTGPVVAEPKMPTSLEPLTFTTTAPDVADPNTEESTTALCTPSMLASPDARP